MVIQMAKQTSCYIIRYDGNIVTSTRTLENAYQAIFELAVRVKRMGLSFDLDAWDIEESVTTCMHVNPDKIAYYIEE